MCVCVCVCVCALSSPSPSLSPLPSPSPSPVCDLHCILTVCVRACVCVRFVHPLQDVCLLSVPGPAIPSPSPRLCPLTDVALHCLLSIAFLFCGSPLPCYFVLPFFAWSSSCSLPSPSYTTGLKLNTPVAILPFAWYYDQCAWAV